MKRKRWAALLLCAALVLGMPPAGAAERLGILAAPIVAEYDGTKLLAPCTYDEKGASVIAAQTVLTLLPECEYVLSYFGWSAQPQTMREHFLTVLGDHLYGWNAPTAYRQNPYAIKTPKNSEQSTTYYFFVDKAYNILAYLDSTMLTPNTSTVPLETKVSIDGGAIYKEATATVAEKLGRAGSVLFSGALI